MKEIIKKDLKKYEIDDINEEADVSLNENNDGDTETEESDSSRELTPSEYEYWKNKYENEKNNKALSEDYSNEEDEEDHKEERHTEATEVKINDNAKIQSLKNDVRMYKTILRGMNHKHAAINKNPLNKIEKFDKVDERILNKSKKKFNLLIKRNRFMDGFNCISKKVINERETTKNFKFNKKSSLYSQVAMERFGIFLFSMLRIMILISHEEYANIQHVMLFKLLFAEIANYIPANEFNKIVMNASKKEVDQATDDIKKK